MRLWRTILGFSRTGFSLVEVLIVVIMLAILAMIVVPKWSEATDPTGKLNPTGTRRPYPTIWPSNPFCDEAVAQKIRFHSNLKPPRDRSRGWYYCLTNGMLYTNSTTGGEEFDPPE